MHIIEAKERQALSTSAPGRWVGYWESAGAGEHAMELPERYAVLLILKGEIVLTFKGYLSQSVGSQSLIVIDRKQLSNFRWAAGTAMLEFTPPVKIFKYFHSCSKAFSLPCSTVVPMLPPLQQWADELMAARQRPIEELSDALRRGFCLRLGNILQLYPPLLVGELLVPFQACAMSGENRCRGELCGLKE